jgi:hypothetical protein
MTGPDSLPRFDAVLFGLLAALLDSWGLPTATGERRASTAMSHMLVVPSAIATAIATSTAPRSKAGDFPARFSAVPSQPVSPCLVSGLSAAGSRRRGRPGPRDKANETPAHSHAEICSPNSATRVECQRLVRTRKFQHS